MKFVKERTLFYIDALSCILGGVLLLFPIDTVKQGYNFLVGSVAIVTALSSIVLYFFAREYSDKFSHRFSIALLQLATGLVLLLSPRSVAFAAFVVGLWTIYYASYNIQKAVSHTERNMFDIARFSVSIAEFCIGILLAIKISDSDSYYFFMLGIAYVLHGIIHLIAMRQWITDAKYSKEYMQVVQKNVRMEAFGFLTVFNFNRSLSVRTKRHIRYCEDRELYLNIHEQRHRDTTKKLPVFFYIHGGGWVTGLPENREAFTTNVAAMGYVVINVYYGLAPQYKHPEQIENIYKAIAYVLSRADELNIDTNKIFVGGESAGGHLSAIVGAIATNPEYNAKFNLDETARNVKISGLVLNCGVYKMETIRKSGYGNIDFYTDYYCGKRFEEMTEEEKREVSPINYVTDNYPPCFLIAAEQDKLQISTTEFCEVLKEHGVPFDYYYGRGRFAWHAFAVAQILRISREAMVGIKGFLKKLST